MMNVKHMRCLLYFRDACSLPTACETTAHLALCFSLNGPYLVEHEHIENLAHEGIYFIATAERYAFSLKQWWG